MTQTISVSDGNVVQYLNSLAERFTLLIARDPDVVLSNDVMEGRNAIAIDNWDDVRETISDALRLWVDAIQNRTALPVPIPKNFYALIYMLVERRLSDGRGDLKFSLDLSPGFLPSNVDSGYQNALFGKNGYLARKFTVYAGTDYLRNGGVPVAPQLVKTKEGKLDNKKDVPVEAKKFTLNIGKVPVEDVKSDLADKLMSSLDGFDPDAFALHSLLPPVDMKGSKPGERVIYMKSLDDVDDAYRPNIAACWAYQKEPQFVRAVFEYDEITRDLRNLMALSVLFAEQASGSTDMPSELPNFPLRGDSINLIEAAYSYMNPMTIEFNGEDTYRTYNSLSSILRDGTVPVTLSESMRANKYRFITYDKHMSGTIFAFPSGRKTFDIGKDDLEGIVNSMQTWKNIFQNVSTIASAPLISLDFNRIAITCKYNIKVGTNATDDKTSTDATMKKPADVVRGNTIMRLAQRMGVYVKSTGGTNKLYPPPVPGQTVNEFIRNICNFDEDDMQTALANAMGEYSGHGINDQADVLNTDLIQALQVQYGASRALFIASGVGCWYDFTKFEERSLISAAGILADALLFPRYTAREHKLVRLGFRKQGKVNTNPTNTIISASLVDRTTRTPKTEQGYALKTLSRLGGFGFGSLLGPLVGQLGGAIGKAVGVPEIGEISNTVGQIGGGLLDAFF